MQPVSEWGLVTRWWPREMLEPVKRIALLSLPMAPTDASLPQHLPFPTA
jgi:hypothetical protein